MKRQRYSGLSLAWRAMSRHRGWREQWRRADPQPAYARYIAIPAGILVSNTWRPDTPTTTGNVSVQVGLSFLSRIVGNAFTEFTPDLRNRFKHRPDPDVN